ncbi:MAG: D-alanyl-D-alanine carboxypeptidase family protein [Opitutia bacterium]
MLALPRPQSIASCRESAVGDESCVRLTSAILLAALAAWSHAAGISRSGMDYDGVICIDAATGQTLTEDRADVQGRPASVTKLMTLLLVLEDIESGAIQPKKPVKVTREAARTGGSQVWLAEGETFSVEELLFALMLQSANDAAVALAVDRAGSTAAFVTRMNERAGRLGMTSTRFASPNGLTEGAGPHDRSTARDLARLCAELARKPAALRYASTRSFFLHRPGGRGLLMTNHNRLLTDYRGCDGLKTGYTSASNASIATTAQRDGRRVIAVVLGCNSPAGAKSEQRIRDQVAVELMDAGFAELRARAEAEAAKKAALKAAPKTTGRPARQPDFWDWLADLFSF